VRDEKHPRFNQRRREEHSGADTDLPISRTDVLCSSSAKQVAPGSGNMR
jgi:hypothetical protein